VLMGVSEAFRTGAEPVVKNSAALRRHLATQSAAQVGELPQPVHLDAVAQAYQKLNDPANGGLRGAPKFPNPPIFRFLWQNAFRDGQPQGQDMLCLMLERMSQGGIYDHLGGGYARYAVDDIWLVPHFEKMLYDNGQLLELLAFAHALRPDPLFTARAAETVGWMDRDMTAERIGGKAAFAASEDADSEGEEGRFYVWTEAEVDHLLGSAAAPFKQAYDVTPTGNWEGHTILRRVTPPGSAEAEATLAAARETLFWARAKRIRPGRDDKVLADWNGLAITGLVRAAAVWDRPDWIERARNAFDFILDHMAAPDGRIHHALRLGRISAAGLLDDQASIARAALSLFGATGEARFLDTAIRLVDVAETLFADGAGGFFTTAADATDVPLSRPRTAHENATPAANGVMAEVLARLYHLTGETRWRDRTEALLRAFSGDVNQLTAMSGLLAAADLLEEAACVVVAGDPAHPRARSLLRAALAAPDPAVVVLRAAAPEALPPGHPAHGKGPGPDGPVAYLCRRGVCGLPIADAATLADRLRQRQAP
ncbi:MAG: thioredoxin domain-containing protein, partial [Acetobacteraceae bacterium]